MANKNVRNTYGMTLPFALILTFIFSSLVGVSYLFVSVNLFQMQSSIQGLQAISIAEGINERVKARLNTKTKIRPSPNQEEKLKDSTGNEEEPTDEEDLASDEFDEQTEDFDEYYADEILKISRYITFREPPEQPKKNIDTGDQARAGEQSTNQSQDTGAPQENSPPKPEAYVEMIGSIDIPRGTTLEKGIMIVVFKDEKINLKLNDIVPEQNQLFKEKLPIPVIKSLSPNYSETNKRGSFVVLGKNISYTQKARFNNKDIYIEDIKSGPSVEFLVSPDVMPGLTKFYWESTPAEFYIIPAFDGSIRPIINEIRSSDENQLLDVKAGQKRLQVKISGVDLYLKKSPPVVIPDVVGIIPKVSEYLPGGKEITVTLDIDKIVEPGSHSLVVATEGGLSNSWLFNVLPPDEQVEAISANTALVTSSITLLDIRVVENLLPLIDENEDKGDKKSQKDSKDNTADKDIDSEDDVDLDNEGDSKEISEGEKLSPFANVDLETVWFLQTSAMIGKTTKTVSEVVHRDIPNVNAAVITNGEITFDGGGYQIIGSTTAMTKLIEPTYISNTVLSVGGPPEESDEAAKAVPEPAGRGKKEEDTPKSPGDLGFTPGSLVAVYKEGERISDLDYSVISNVGRDTIKLVPPGLMDFHYEGDLVFQFIPPIIAKEKITDEETQKHIIPKDFSIGILNYAKFNNIFRSNLEQFAELADLYTNDTTVPKDEYGLGVGYMGLSYIDGTPTYDNNNVLAGKGVLIIDTRSDNQGRPAGDVEISGDSKNPVDLNGIVYVHGNLRIEGNVTINGALIVDDESRGKIQVASNALGMITWDPRAIKQTILSIPFTTKSGTVMISNKPIDLTGYILSGKDTQTALGTSSGNVQAQVQSSQPSATSTEETLVEATSVPPNETEKIPDEKRPIIESLPVSPGGKSAEEELIDLF
ncbi:MAG: hypothetical protein HY094_05515 [Candidatus Melainabacteria bacterium]|nr:hypothetical protein [Candidatus Melainabacteria bacterium]